MIVWSSLVRASNPVKALVKIPLRNNVLTKIPNRASGHGPEEMWIRPSVYSWEVFKNFLHLYVMVGAIPLGCISFYCNVFIGPAKLAPIPEGYEPQEWEYYRHPITRFFAKYQPSHREKYERRCHYSHEEMEKFKLKQLEKKVREVMQKKLDYQGWYYRPNTHGKYHRVEMKERRESHVHRSSYGVTAPYGTS